jgi:thiol:disulfide interchange protein
MLGIGARANPRTRRTIHTAAFAAILGALALVPGLATAPQPATGLVQTEGAESFTADRLASFREAGRPVFVNLTAAWCVTCLVNERVVLHAPEVRQAFTDANVAYLVGDWTRQDSTLTRFLRAQGRDGVPLYLFYPAGGKPPIELPQILTTHTVLQAVGGED